MHDSLQSGMLFTVTALVTLTCSQLAVTAISVCSGSSSNIDFVTVFTVKGCPLYVHRFTTESRVRGEANKVKQQHHYLIEPALCIADVSWLNSSMPRYDPITNTSYVVLPLLLQNDAMRMEVKRQIEINGKERVRRSGPLNTNATSFFESSSSSISSISFSSNSSRSSLRITSLTERKFLKPASVRFLQLTAANFHIVRNPAFTAGDFVWSEGEGQGFLRILCNCTTCFSLSEDLKSGKYHVIENIKARLRTSLTANGKVGQCSLRPQSRQIAIANRSIALDQFNSRRLHAARVCRNLHFVQTVRAGNCTISVHKIRGQRSAYALQPALCYHGNAKLQRDLNAASCCRIDIHLSILNRPETLDAVQSQLTHLRYQSLTVMELQSAELLADAAVSAKWLLQQPLLVSHDRGAAVMRIRCFDWHSCILLSKVLDSDPINFWQHIKWTSVSELTPTASSSSSSSCLVHQEIPVHIYRQQEVAKPLWPRAAPNNCVTWSLGELIRSKSFSRGPNRQFIVFQRRFDGHVEFSRGWSDYVDGFGDDREFWIGLKYLHELTKSPKQMRVEVLAYNNKWYVAEYRNFSVANASSDYAMTYHSYVRVNTTQDSLANNKNKRFSTKDADNDGVSSKHCSVEIGGQGGWWFGSSNCGYANPNGVLMRINNRHGMSWYGAKSSYHTLRETRLMLEI